MLFVSRGTRRVEQKIFDMRFAMWHSVLLNIEFMERCGTEFASGNLAKLEVVEVPDQTTDWRIVTDERGSERLFYVVDGKLYG